MMRTLLPDAVEWYSDAQEWAEFSEWREKPKPIMLDRNGRFPDVPHELADHLFDRVIQHLRTGDLVALGRWGQRSAFEEIEPEHWLTSWYNIWFNELGYGDEGRVGFSGILVEQRPKTVADPPLQAKRTAVKRFMKDWCEANPDAKITRADMLEKTKSELSTIGGISTNMFNETWRREFPAEHKFRNRPPLS
ncbi:hypothetical protein [Erythrobacter sp. F6033]|uniref:hypothetical protein n=1 Tax=Erythrobacter sp. F6033 TaxID=2926401 RepID=UPI001FF437FA|nr:hypothetical protein [Erythrobacter sp. F6033]MCK0129277.1 hypothetical protein [Erythrobacter sp. F6033]